MSSRTTEPAKDRLAGIAKAINDLDDLVRLVDKGLSREKPWQWQLSRHLADIDRLLQVLRMTITLDRPEIEISEAANSLRTACCKAGHASNGSRADLTTKTAVRLAVNLSGVIREALTSGAASGS